VRPSRRSGTGKMSQRVAGGDGAVSPVTRVVVGGESREIPPKIEEAEVFDRLERQC